MTLTPEREAEIREYEPSVELTYLKELLAEIDRLRAEFRDFDEYRKAIKKSVNAELKCQKERDELRDENERFRSMLDEAAAEALAQDDQAEEGEK